LEKGWDADVLMRWWKRKRQQASYSTAEASSVLVIAIEGVNDC
jgi:hypothetical protein